LGLKINSLFNYRRNKVSGIACVPGFPAPTGDFVFARKKMMGGLDISKAKNPVEMGLQCIICLAGWLQHQ
jgi:hypothetical protein